MIDILDFFYVTSCVGFNSYPPLKSEPALDQDSSEHSHIKHLTGLHKQKQNIYWVSYK